MARRVASKRRRGNGGGGKRKFARTAARMPSRNQRTGGFTGMESKFLDCAWNGVGINVSTDGSAGELQPSTGCTNAVSVPAQGNSEITRDGRKYTITSCWVNGVINTSPEQDEVDLTSLTGYWFALVHDKQCNNSTIVSEDVYINPATSGRSMMPQPLRNLEKSSRFTILAKQYVLPASAYAVGDGTNTSSINMQYGPKVNLSWKGKIRVECSATGADVASATNSAIHVLAFAGTSFGTPVFFGKSRLRFVG